MADNITLNSGSGGAVLAADDISSVFYQIVKVAFGALDTATLVTTSAGLPIDIRASNATVTVDLGANNDVTIDASSVVHAEDAAHSGGQSGIMAMGIRDDALTADALVNADLDYLPFRMNNDGALWMQPSAGNLGGCKGFFSNDLDESEEQIASAACTMYGVYAWNATAAPLWLQIFNVAAASVTVGTTAPTFNYIIPANADSDGAGVVVPIPVQGQAFATALTMAITTGVGTDNGAPGANDAGVYVLYQD